MPATGKQQKQQQRYHIETKDLGNELVRPMQMLPSAYQFI